MNGKDDKRATDNFHFKRNSRVGYKDKFLTKQDLNWFAGGTHSRLYEKMGAHCFTIDGIAGTYFSVWAPNAKRVSVIGVFNDWDWTIHPLDTQGRSGVWQGFVPGATKGDLYKYHIVSKYQNYVVDKSDPFSLFNEMPPNTASIIWDLDYTWSDQNWMKQRCDSNSLSAPISIYEVHLGSWMRITDDDNRSLSYREIAIKLTEYVKEMGFTHVELMPVMEHPFFGSWGYQVTGYFSPSSRYGSPQDFMYLIDYLHQHDIGVILDWVPSHFPTDKHGLGFFDGTHLYEYSDPKKGFHPDWNSFIFNYGRHEVKSFLLSNALFWLDKYHADGLRVDGVASLLYLDYSRKEGEWVPNKYGGRENLEAIDFLRRLNEAVYKNYPDVQTIAEESTAWPLVSRPTYLGGLGFGMKWDMGWMHDMLHYMTIVPIQRQLHHDKLTFRMLYAYSENFLLPLSHDEVAYGKGSLLSKMPGDDRQKFANLRLLLSYTYTQPGKKLLFMGGEFGQVSEWNHDGSLAWNLLRFSSHKGIQRLVRDINGLYYSEPALYELDFDPAGFEWIDCNDSENSVVTFIRKGHSVKDVLVVVCNFTPVVRTNYHVGVPFDKFWAEIFNSDALCYDGSGQGNGDGVAALSLEYDDRPFCLKLTLPPLAVVIFKPQQPTNEPAAIISSRSLSE